MQEDICELKAILVYTVASDQLDLCSEILTWKSNQTKETDKI